MVVIIRHAHPMPPHLTKPHKSVDNARRRQLYYAIAILKLGRLFDRLDDR